MKTVAIYSSKGGVGKTSTSVNLAYCFAKFGYRTLLWDLDAQGASTFYFNIKPKAAKIKKILNNKISLSELIRGSDYTNLDIMPADFTYRNIDLILDDTKKSKKQLKFAIESIYADYDIVLLDSPPSVSALSESLFYASDFILTPVIPTTLSVMTYNQLIEHLTNEAFNLEKLFAFFSMVDIRKTLHKNVMTSLADDERFLKQLVPYSSTIEKMGVHRAPVGEFEPKSISSICYDDLAKELSFKFQLSKQA